MTDRKQSDTGHARGSRRRSRAHDLGATLVEYALLIALIAVTCIGAITYFGNGGQTSLENSTNSIVSAN